MAYYNIYLTPGLPEPLRRRALRAGPSAVTSRGVSQTDLVRRAGFSSVQETDLTREFLLAARGWYSGRQRHAEEVTKAMGDQAFGEAQADSRRLITAIEDGLLRRGLFVAVAT